MISRCAHRFSRPPWHSPHCPAGDQWIDDHGGTRNRAVHSSAYRFVTENQRRLPRRIVTEIGVHIRSANAYGVDGNDNLSGTWLGRGFVPELDLFFGGVDQCFQVRILPCINLRPVICRSELARE